MSNRNKFILSIVGVVASLAFLVAVSILAEEAIISATLAVVLTLISIILVLVSIIFAAKVDYETGVYECRSCGHVFKPKFMAYLFGPHSLTTRCLKCPEFENTTWCKRNTVK